jgi:hypothetical protein
MLTAVALDAGVVIEIVVGHNPALLHPGAGEPFVRLETKAGGV